MPKRRKYLPPKNNEQVSLKTKSLICYNEGSTSYSLGDIDNTYVFSDDRLTVKSQDDEKTYEIVYSPKEVDKKEFEKSLQNFNWGTEIDISNYKKCLQYDLYMGVFDKQPGYRLYILDDEYWMGTLYGNRLFRCVTLELVK